MILFGNRLRKLFKSLTTILLIKSVEVLAQTSIGAAATDPYLQAMELLEQGRMVEAVNVLQRLVDEEPHNAGAYLDLASLHCRMGDLAKAEKLFTDIEARFAPPPSILDVIVSQRATGCSSADATSYMRLRMSRGWSDNANQGSSVSIFSLGTGADKFNVTLAPEYAPRPDGFSALTLEWSAPLPGTKTIALVQAGAQAHDSSSQYDQAFLSGALEHPWRAKNWAMRSLGAVNLSSLGGEAYQQQALMKLIATPPLSLPTDWNFDGSLGLSQVAFLTQPNFDSQMKEVRLMLIHTGAKGFVKADVGYTWDRGKALRPGGDREGTGANVHARFRLEQDLFGELGVSYQGWRGKQTYAPKLIDMHRNQDTLVVRAGLMVPLTRKQELFFEWRTVQNRENISLFAYKSQSLQLGWQWQTGH